MPTRIALVAGATGATAKRLVELLENDPDWRVVGLCRHPPPNREKVAYVAVDLMDPDETRAKLARHADVTHVFYCSRAQHGESGIESVADNVAMLRHVVEAATAAATNLEHIHLIEGGKWYGMHIGPFPTPAREDDPRHLPPDFYYDQQDYLVAAQARQPAGKSARWTWSASRPNFITDFAPERPRNLVAVLGAWASICREAGMRLEFPGKTGAFTALSEITDATHLARAMRHIATTPQCANQAFNVTNGEPIRWQRFWPRLAKHYGLEVGSVRPLQLAQWMADKEPMWQRITTRHGLLPTRLVDVAQWNFGDFALNQDHDVFYSLLLLRGTGFLETVDTEATIIRQLQQYREARILP